jgi:WD40 repeat protein
MIIMRNLKMLYVNIFLIIELLIVSSFSQSLQRKIVHHDVNLFVAHDAPYVTALAFSPDGKLLATGSPDEKVKIWRVSNLYDSKMIFEPNKGAKKILRVQGMVNSLAFSPKGDLLAVSANREKGVVLWNTRTWTKEKTISSPKAQLLAGDVIFSSDGRYLAIGYDDTYVYEVSLPNSPLKLVKVVPHAISSIAFSPDSKLFADGNPNNLSIWSTKTWKCIRSFTGQWGLRYHGKPEMGPGAFIDAIAFSHNNKWLAASSDDYNIRIFNTTTWKIIKTINNGGYSANIAFSPNDKALAVTGETVRLLDTTTWKNRQSAPLIGWDQLPWDPPSTLKNRKTFLWSCVKYITVDPVGRNIAMSGEGPLVALWHY